MAERTNGGKGGQGCPDDYRRVMRFFDALVEIDRTMGNPSTVQSVSFYEYPDNVYSQKEGVLVNFDMGYVSDAVEHVPLSAREQGLQARFALGNISINFRK